MAAGHPLARRYTLGRVQLEYLLLEQRERQRLHDQALFTHLAMAATQPSKRNASGKAFEKALKSLLPD